MYARHMEKGEAEKRDGESDDCLSLTCSPISTPDEMNSVPVVRANPNPVITRSTAIPAKRRVMNRPSKIDVKANLISVARRKLKTVKRTETGVGRELKIREPTPESQGSQERMANKNHIGGGIPMKRKARLSGNQDVQKVMITEKNVAPAEKKEMKLDVAPSQEVNRSISKQAFFGAKYSDMLSSEFEEMYHRDEEPNSLQQERMSMRAGPANRNNNRHTEFNNNTELNVFNARKTVLNNPPTSSSAVSSEVSDIKSKYANPESRMEQNWRNSNFVDLHDLLNYCENLDCKERDMHQVPSESANLNSKRAEELRNSFLDHLPLIIKLMWGNKVKISNQNCHSLIRQILEAIRVYSLNRDFGHAFAILLRTAISCFNKHYKIIHDILVHIKVEKVENIVEALRPLLSKEDFNWPIWLQRRIVTRLTDCGDKARADWLETHRDFTPLAKFLNSEFYTKLQMSVETDRVDQSEYSPVPECRMQGQGTDQTRPFTTAIRAHLNENNSIPMQINSKSSKLPNAIECPDKKSSDITFPTQSTNKNFVLPLSRQIDINSRSTEFPPAMSNSSNFIPPTQSTNNNFVVPLSRQNDINSRSNEFPPPMEYADKRSSTFVSPTQLTYDNFGHEPSRQINSRSTEIPPPMEYADKRSSTFVSSTQLNYDNFGHEPSRQINSRSTEIPPLMEYADKRSSTFVSPTQLTYDNFGHEPSRQININSNSSGFPVAMENLDKNSSNNIFPAQSLNRNLTRVEIARWSNSVYDVGPAIECADKSSSDDFFPAQPLNSNLLQVPISSSNNIISEPAEVRPTMECSDGNFSIKIFPAQSLSREISERVTEILLLSDVNRALCILENFQAEQLYEVALHIFREHSADYEKVVNVMLEYFKERRCMHFLMKNFDVFLSTLVFNFVVKLFNDGRKGDAYRHFHTIIQSGLDYFNVQVFPELLCESYRPYRSSMDNVMIAVDVFIAADKYDNAAKLLIDNCLLKGPSEWKVPSTCKFDLVLRDRCIQTCFDRFLNDSRPTVIMLACRLFSQMQEQRCPFASSEDQVIRILKKLLPISTFDKLAYEIFKKFFLNINDNNKPNLVVAEAPICRAMLIISHSVDPDYCPILLHEFLELALYPKWQVRDVLIFHSNWTQIEIEMLFENFVQQLLDRRDKPSWLGFVLPKQLRFSVEQCAKVNAIAALDLDVSIESAIYRLQELLSSLRPRMKGIVSGSTLTLVKCEWQAYFHKRYQAANQINNTTVI